MDLPENALDVEPTKKSCFSCDLEKEKADNKDIYLVDDDTITLHGLAYHISDFVYSIPSGQTKLLNIGQIVKIDKLGVTVCVLGRYDDYVVQQKSLEGGDTLVFDEVS